VEEVLRALYRLQQIDLELDELNEGSADLPGEVQELEQRIKSIEGSIASEEGRLHDLRRGRNDSKAGIEALRERVRHLNEQLRTVRNNREYEATTHDIAAAEAELQTTERSMMGLDGEEANIMRGIETLKGQKEEAATELEEKTGTLKMLHETHADEINELRTARETVVAQLNDELLRKYEHIRTAYSDAVVKVRKGACAGCYRSITPQTIIEMRRNEQMFICEHCGRILVDEETVASVGV
jgi:predicted  nucleic acid-binding Zn-ribbon protein